MKLASSVSTRLATVPLIFAALVISPATGFAQANSVLRTYRASNWTTQIFLCDNRVAASECKSEVEILKTHMQAYPVGQLGAWTWVLVRSDRWKDLGLDSESPAYTAIEERLTLIDESMLVEKNALRTEELMRKFELPLPQLVDFAVTHEMGHALCGFKEEGKADAVGRRLREGKLPYCSIPVKMRDKFPVRVQADVWGGTTQEAAVAASK
jgi:hypothetical protein